MFWDPNLREIKVILANLYPDREDARSVVEHIDRELLGKIVFTGSGENMWHDILKKMNSRGRLNALIEYCIDEKGSLRLREKYAIYLAMVPDPPAGNVSFVGPGSFVTCDRKKQERAFNHYFEHFFAGKRGFPQVYIVPGDVNQRHDSLVERFVKTSITDCVNESSQIGPETGAIRKWKVAMEAHDDLQESRKFFFNDLFGNFKRKFGTLETEPNATSFRNLLKGSGYPALVIQHDIKMAEWNKTSGQLMSTYLQFLDEIEDDSLPQVIVFFCIIYPAERDGLLSGLIPQSWKKPAGSKYLEKLPGIFDLQKAADATRWMREEPPRVQLDTLGCVNQNDLLEWFQSSNFGGGELNCFKHARLIVGEDECKSMMEVETALTDLLLDLNGSLGKAGMARG
jgi:hypothetical protein